MCIRDSYYTDDCSYRLPQKRLTARWLREVAEAEGYVLGDVNYIFCSAARLLEMNRRYLSLIHISTATILPKRSASSRRSASPEAEARSTSAWSKRETTSSFTMRLSKPKSITIPYLGSRGSSPGVPFTVTNRR